MCYKRFFCAFRNEVISEKEPASDSYSSSNKGEFLDEEIREAIETFHILSDDNFDGF